MKKKVLALLTILVFVVLATAAFAQSSTPGDQGTRPGPGYSTGGGMMYGEGQSQGPGQRQGQDQDTNGPGMMGGQGQGQGTNGPGMMYGYGAGWMGGYGRIWVVIVLVLLVAALVAWIVKQRRQVN